MSAFTRNIQKIKKPLTIGAEKKTFINTSIPQDDEKIYLFSPKVDKRIDQACVWVCILAALYLLGHIVRWAV